MLPTHTKKKTKKKKTKNKKKKKCKTKQKLVIKCLATNATSALQISHHKKT